jgi:hypothetical protein
MNRVLAVVLVLVLASCDRQTDYRKAWVGTYQGEVELGTQYPSTVGGNWTMFDTTYTQPWTIEVALNGDSSLALTGFRDTVVADFGVLKVPASGIFFRQTGGGSSYAELGIVFGHDSLTWNSFNKCGIPCSSWARGILYRN